ncbi:MAG TPA: serine protease [Candidatus Sulfotelmatobacter sp.]|nr:serine protease [Candidatus Sulfotelmatobacter sp.]
MFRTVTITVLVCFVGMSYCGYAANITTPREKVLSRSGKVEKLDSPIVLYPLPQISGQAFSQTVPSHDRAARLHFRAVALPIGFDNWSVVVTGGNQKRWIWAASSGGDSKDFWSEEMTSPIEVTVITPTPTAALKLEIDRVAEATNPSAPASIVGEDDRVKFDYGNGITAEMRQWSKSVARLRFVGDDGGEWLCTAFLVSPTLMLTNHHCVNSDTELRSALADFDYVVGVPPSAPSTFSKLVLTNVALDYSLMRLSSPSQYSPLLFGADPKNNDTLVLIEHPAGEVKQVSILDCRVEGATLDGISQNGTDFGHRCDTLGGSSGSPVLKAGKIVGLHHLGVDPSGSILVNRAVKISLLLSDIKSNAPDIAAEIGVP